MTAILALMDGPEELGLVPCQIELHRDLRSWEDAAPTQTVHVGFLSSSRSRARAEGNPPDSSQSLSPHDLTK